MRFDCGCDKFIAVVISTAVSSSSISSTLILGDAGHSISLFEGDSAVEANDWGETESLPDEYPQSEDDESVLVVEIPGKLEDAVVEEE